MSVKVMGLVWDAKGLSSTEKLVLLSLADHANHQGERVFPSMNLLVQKTGLAERTVGKTRSKLCSMGVLTLIEAAHRGRTPIYRINIDVLEKAALDAAFLESKSAEPQSDEQTLDSEEEAPHSEKGVLKEPPQPSLTITNHHEPSKELTTELTKAEIEETSHKTAAWLKMAILGNKGLCSWPNAPEHLRIILVEFTRVWCDLYGFKLQDGEHKKFIKQAGQLYDQLGGETVGNVVFKAGEEHRRAKLDIDGPLSLRYKIRSLLAEPQPIEKTQPAERSSRVWTGS